MKTTPMMETLGWLLFAILYPIIAAPIYLLIAFPGALCTTVVCEIRRHREEKKRWEAWRNSP